MGKPVSKQNDEIRERLSRRGINATIAQVNTLRRAERTLQRWSELECGDSNEYASFGLERDERTGKPYRTFYPHKGEPRRYPTPDRERGAINRVSAICNVLRIHFYRQGDPRGCALYVDREPLTGENYTRGVAICC